MSYKTDPWSPLYGGAISTPGACWVRLRDRVCFAVVSYAEGRYVLANGAGAEITVTTDELGTAFAPT
jgi:hypothetical protein